ncbi:hypothetical protein L6452_07930 [Arctium lappa]|uniref:Uncharacterized protein n=1 Tax=Arctium lappa TaxID=4217 RepID=A0ACB9EM87_ARCLA|nr:hypothetical protein L6452_07930 [Arctium lappa]
MARQKHLVSRPSQPPRRSLRHRSTVTPSTSIDSSDKVADAEPQQPTNIATSVLSSTNIAVAQTAAPPPQTAIVEPTSSVSSTQGIFTSGGSPAIPSFDAPTPSSPTFLQSFTESHEILTLVPPLPSSSSPNLPTSTPFLSIYTPSVKIPSFPSIDFNLTNPIFPQNLQHLTPIPDPLFTPLESPTPSTPKHQPNPLHQTFDLNQDLAGDGMDDSFMFNFEDCQHPEYDGLFPFEKSCGPEDKAPKTTIDQQAPPQKVPVDPHSGRSVPTVGTKPTIIDPQTDLFKGTSATEVGTSKLSSDSRSGSSGDTESASSENDISPPPEQRARPEADSDSDFEAQLRADVKGKGTMVATHTRSSKRKRTDSGIADKKIWDRYKQIKHNDILMERPFAPEFICSLSHVQHHLTAMRWDNLVDVPCKANVTLVTEFFAAIAITKKNPVLLRGKWVDWSGPQINKVLKLKVPFVCSFNQISNNLLTVTDKQISDLLLAPGRDWALDNRRLMIQANSLTEEAAVWFQFLRHNVNPTAHDCTLSRDRCVLLYCILKECPVDLGPIACSAIESASRSKKARLIFPALITKLCALAKVPTFDDDKLVSGSVPIDRHTLERRSRSSKTPSVLQVPPQDAAPPQAPMPSVRRSPAPKTANPTTSYGYGTAEWLATSVMQQEETNQTLKAMLVMLTDLQTRVSRLEERRSAADPVVTASVDPTVATGSHSGLKNPTK